MYASRLGNGNGNGDGNGGDERDRYIAQLKAEMFPPTPPDPCGSRCGPPGSPTGGSWPFCNPSVTGASLEKWNWSKGVLTNPPFSWDTGAKLNARLTQECQQGWPMWNDEQFRLKISRYVPTVEETAVAFVEELTKLAPAPPTTGPTVVTPPDSLIAPPLSSPSPLAVTESVESAASDSLMDKYAAQQGQAADPWEMQAYVPAPPPSEIPAHVLQAEFPLMRQYGEQIEATAADVTPPGEVPAAPPEKKGAGIGTVLLLAAPLALTLL